jgi:hypothetical protein
MRLVIKPLVVKPFVVGLVAITAALAADVSSPQAQESFFNKRFCTQGGGNRSSGAMDCGYNTWAQCIESARGLGRYCTENPFWQGDRREPTTQGRGRRQRDQ